MKKFIFCLCFIFITFIAIKCFKTYAYSETGHDDFKKITFVEGGHLLNDISSDNIDFGYSRVKKCLFGWSTHYFNIEDKANYDGIVIFSRSNRSSDSLSFNYVIKETKVTQKSVAIKGSVSAKVSGTIKKINLGLNGDISGEKEISTKYTKDEESSVKLTISPNSNLTLLVTGTCYVTNGCSKYYFLGIPLKKGCFETIDCETLIYELRETKL